MLNNIIYIAPIVLFVAVFAVYSVYRLRQKRSSEEHHVAEAARTSYGDVIRAVLARVPAADDYWDNKIIEEMPYIAKMINRAVLELLPFLPPEQHESLEKEWLYLKSFIADKLPRELIAAGAMYASSVAATRAPKQSFHRGIQSLLKYAN